MNETYSGKSGVETLWATYSDELCANGRVKTYTSTEVISLVRSLGLECQEYITPFNIDITECFDPDSHNGERLLAIVTEKDDFTPEVREGMLDYLKNKCSTEKNGRILLNNDFSCIIINA